MEIINNFVFPRRNKNDVYSTTRIFKIIIIKSLNNNKCHYQYKIILTLWIKCNSFKTNIT